jgi:hypothetical protein
MNIIEARFNESALLLDSTPFAFWMLFPLVFVFAFVFYSRNRKTTLQAAGDAALWAVFYIFLCWVIK